MLGSSTCSSSSPKFWLRLCPRSLAHLAGQAAMAIQIWMVVAGFAMICHAGSGLMADKAAADLIGEGISTVSSQVFLEVIIGAVMAMWGSIGEFKPIRIDDSKKPRWESLHCRPDFQCYTNRAKLIRPLLESSFPQPPGE
mmetsp:Transcript_85701/g.276589  ORF Transcript_85701/g.276589 Transcript_85701/m.276589 type:complete len:140 (+) Transcript_85701:10-429(+)